MDRIIAARVFCTIAERTSLTAAAEALDMSRAMVTRYLAEMEEWTGTRLLHRTTRRVSLTAAGEGTLVRCREMLRLADLVPAARDTESGSLRGVLRIATSPSVAKATLTRAIGAFLQQHPQASIDLQVAYKTVNLIEDRIDLAIRVTNQLDPGLIARRLGDCPLVICASPDYLRQHPAPRHVEDLRHHNCLCFAYFSKSVWSFRRGEEFLDIPVSGNFSANDSLALLSAAIDGFGISQQPLLAAAPYIASGQLIPLLPEFRPLTLGIYGVYSSREYQPVLLRAMLDFLGTWFGTTARLYPPEIHPWSVPGQPIDQ